MSQARLLLTAVLSVTTLIFCSCTKRSTDEAKQMMDKAYKSKDYQRLLTLADSLEREGDLLPSAAYYWRGYVCDRTKRKQEAVGYWQLAIAEAAESDADEDVDIYVKSASRLANQLCVDGDYVAALKMARPVVERLEQLKCDTTSDYINLLIYIGLSQVGLGQSEEESHQGFYRACEKHRQNIDRLHSDDAYKDAIAGLVNIAYYCVMAEKYEPALYYTRNFGELLIEYEQHRGVDSAYIDRQIGRYTIYKATALRHLGRQKEADATYNAFLETKFSKSNEGQSMVMHYN